MAVHRLSFVDAVGLLLEKQAQSLKTFTDHLAIDRSNRPPTLCGSMAPKTGRPTALGQSIPSVIDSFRKPQSQEKCCDGCKRLEQSLAEIQCRLSQLENHFARLNLPTPY